MPIFELFTTLRFRVAGGVAKILCDEGLYNQVQPRYSYKIYSRVYYAKFLPKRFVLNSNTTVSLPRNKRVCPHIVD